MLLSLLNTRTSRLIKTYHFFPFLSISWNGVSFVVPIDDGGVHLLRIYFYTDISKHMTKITPMAIPTCSPTSLPPVDDDSPSILRFRFCVSILLLFVCPM